MTTRKKTSRPNFVRQGRKCTARSALQLKRSAHPELKTYQHTASFIPVKSRSGEKKTLQPATYVSNVRRNRNLHRNNYEFAFTFGHTNIRTPALTLPQMGPRWISGAIIMILSFVIFALWTATPFAITTAKVRGNLRVNSTDINSAIGLVGQSIVKVIPNQIEANLHATFPDLESIIVHVNFPNQISVIVKERIPTIAWYQDGVVTWVDKNGVAFLPRGDISGLIQVSATDAPASVSTDSTLPFYEQNFITPGMIQMLVDLADQVPDGTPILFDSQYGFGWQDQRGWTVYFGLNNKDIMMKKTVYQSIVDSLTLQGVQPSLISVAYLNAPFYK